MKNYTPTTNPTDRKWFALLRLTCYVWALILLIVLRCYNPNIGWLFDGLSYALVFAIGLCTGRNWQLIKGGNNGN